MSIPSLEAWSRLATRMVIALCALTLLVTTVPALVPAASADLGSAIATSRQSQRHYERTMLAQDHKLLRNAVRLKKTKHAFKRTKRSHKQTRRMWFRSVNKLAKRRARVAQLEAMYPTPDDAPKPWRFKAGLQRARQQMRAAERRKRYLGKRTRSLARARKARLDRISALKRQRRVTIARRESAEGNLAAHIVRMTSLAASRAETQATVQLSAGGGSFSWPSAGRISQTYGCTGFYINPRRGSCNHFHDGLDIVAAHGSPVRAAAVGVVAYVGWNPWDENGRAFIVVVAHPDGFVTRYGHLMSKRRVRAGEVVHTGQTIGKMGNTGRSTGTHVHFELLKGGSDVNPFGYLPSGGHKIKIDRTSTRKGVAKAQREARAKARAAAKRQAARARKAARQAARRAASRAATTPAACDEQLASAEPQLPLMAGPVFGFTLAADPRDETFAAVAGTTAEIDDPCAPASDDVSEAAAADGASASRSEGSTPTVEPGVRLPFRGTSPIPE